LRGLTQDHEGGVSIGGGDDVFIREDEVFSNGGAGSHAAELDFFEGGVPGK